MNIIAGFHRSWFVRMLLLAMGGVALLALINPAAAAQNEPAPAADSPARIHRDLLTGETVIVSDDNRAVDTASPTDSGSVPDATDSFSPLFQVHQPTTVKPYSPIVKLTISGWSGTSATTECSGTLISARWVLTAGECVYNPGLGGWAASIRIVPALTPTSEPFGGAWAASIVAWQPWVDDQNIDYNVAHIQLDRPVGALTGSHGIGFGSDILFENFSFSGLGYPYGDAFQINRMHEWSGTFDTISARQVAHNEPGNPGMIGSAALSKLDTPEDLWSAYAVYAPIPGESTSNYTRLVEELVQAVIDDINAATDPTFNPVPLDVNVAPAQVTAGETLTKIDYMLFNEGADGFSGNIEHRVLLSTDVNIDCEEDIELASRKENISLAPSARPRVTFNNVSVPDDLGGEYFVGICAISAQDTGVTIAADDLAPLTIDALVLPALDVAPASVTLAGIAGEVVTPAQVSVQNTGGGILSWTASADVNWLSLNPASGAVAAGSPASVTVGTEAAALGPGTHNGTITFEAANGESITVPVSLTLQAPNSGTPLLQVSPSLINFAFTTGGTLPASIPFTIDNIGGGTLNWTATAGVPWLQLSKGSGSGEATINVSAANLGVLPRGTHIGAITVTAPGADASPQVVTVALVISAAPTLAVDGTTLAFTGQISGETPGPSSFFIRNDGDGTLNWAVSESIPWLSVAKTGGSGPAEVGVTVQPGGLSAGTYSGTIRVAATGAQGSPRDIQITLVMRPGPRLEIGPLQILADTTTGNSPTGKSIEVANRGLGTMNWTGEVATLSGGNWLSLGQTAGSVGAGGKQVVPLTFNTAGLAARPEPYEATVTIRSANALGGPQTVNVLLTVRSAARFCNIAAAGNDWPVNTSQIKVGLEVAQSKPTADGGCDISGKLNLRLPQNANLSTGFSGHVTSANKLTATTTSNVSIGIASFKLVWGGQFTLDEAAGLQFTGATWQLPADFGSIQQPINSAVRIAPDGIRIAGSKEFSLPNLNWSNMAFTGNKATINVATDSTYTIDITSAEMKIAVSGSPVATADDVTLRIDQRGVRSGDIGRFDVTGFAGLRLEVLGATIEGDRILAQQARLHMPMEWGEQYVSLFRLSINKNGTASIGDAGGRFSFSLPSISAGGFTLTSLTGYLELEQGGRYRINARGEFGLPQMKSVGSCRLWVDVTLRAGPNGTSVLEMTPVQSGPPLALTSTPDQLHAPQTPDALVLEQFTAGLRCKPGIPISNTGLYAVGVEGTVLLKPADGGSQSVTLKLWVESQAAVGSTPMIGIEAAATVIPQPFELGMSASVKLIGIETANGQININARRMAATVEIQYHIVKLNGSMEIGRRTSDNKFYVNGSASGSIGTKRGQIYEGCIDLIVKELCAAVPPSTVWMQVGRIDIGTFNTGGYGLKGYVGIGSWVPSWTGIPSQIGFFINFQNPGIKFGDVSSYQPIKPVSSLDYLSARAAWEEARRNTRAVTPLDNRFEFNADGSFSIPVPVESLRAILQPLDSQHPIEVDMPRDLMFILVQEQGSPLDMSLVRPDDVILTPDNLPGNAGYTEDVSAGLVQTMYLVPEAMAGKWRVNLTGPTGSTEWGLFVIGNDPPPTFDESKLAAKVKADPTKVEVSWQLATIRPATIAIYADDGPATPSFTGVALVEGVTSQAGKTTVDLKLIPSGTYGLWIEADDGVNPPVRHYIPAGNGLFSVTVDHGGTFPTQWTADVELTPDLKNRSLLVEWQPLAHADIDLYRLQLRYADPLEPAGEILRVTEIGLNADSGGYQGILDNIEPGQVYHVAIGGVDLDSGKVAWSQEVELATAQPDFLLAAGQTPVVLPACGVAVKLPISVTPTSNLAEPVLLGVQAEELPDGIYAHFDTEIVGEPGSVMLTMSASDSLPAGNYAIAVTGMSGYLQRELILNVSAAGNAGEDCAQSGVLMLPVVVRP